jgi:UDP:flavonoid glycosyltransferase YjiC (YdhE family)
MRVLFSCTPGSGHFLPLQPLARAFADDGHTVAFATSDERSDEIAEAGYEHLPAGSTLAEAAARMGPHWKRLRELPIHERRPYTFRSRFALCDAPYKLDDLLTHARGWRPDLIVTESADLAAPLVSAVLDVPLAHQGFGRIVPIPCWEAAAEAVEPLWRDAGLEPEPLCGAFRNVYVDICPPSFQTSQFPPVRAVERLRPATPEPGSPPPLVDGLPGRPTVYVTLGTVMNAIDAFRPILDALAGEDVNVVATIGRDNDPAALEPLPANARVERFVPQAAILPHVDVVVAHGGSGSTLATMAHGLPMLVVPMGADQFENAMRCAELGIAIALYPGEVSPDAVRDGVRTLLADPSYRSRAREVADEIAAMPDATQVAASLVTV